MKGYRSKVLLDRALLVAILIGGSFLAGKAGPSVPLTGPQALTGNVCPREVNHPSPGPGGSFVPVVANEPVESLEN